MFLSIPVLFVFALLLYWNDKQNKRLLVDAENKAAQLAIRVSDLSFETDMLRLTLDHTQSLLNDEKVFHERTTEKLNEYREIAENLHWQSVMKEAGIDE